MKQYIFPFFVAISLGVIGATYFTLADVHYGGQDLFGAISYPTSLDTFTNPSPTDRTNSPSHATQHANANDAIEALQAKVGINNSAVNTSHDFKLSGVSDGDYAASLTGTEVLTNKTLTSPLMTLLTATSADFFNYINVTGTTTLTGITSINASSDTLSVDVGSDATGDIYYRNASGSFVRLGLGTNGQFLQVSGGLPSWQTSQASAPTIIYNATSTASTTASLITTDTQLVYVTAYGSWTGDGTGGNITFNLDVDGVNKDSFVIGNPGSGTEVSFYLSYSELPGQATSTITVLQDKGGANVDSTIVIQKY